DVADAVGAEEERSDVEAVLRRARDGGDQRRHGRDVRNRRPRAAPPRRRADLRTCTCGGSRDPPRPPIAASALGNVIPSGHADRGFTQQLFGRAHMQVSTQGTVRVSRRRTRAVVGAMALCTTVTALLFSAGVAGAAVTTGPVDPASGFPSSYTDDSDGLSLQQCQDGSAFCIEAPRPNPAAPISVPDNYTPDGEGFWWVADATVPNAGRGLARFAKESAFDNDEIS